MTNAEFLTQCETLATEIDARTKVTATGPKKDFLNQCKAPEIIQIVFGLRSAVDLESVGNRIEDFQECFQECAGDQLAANVAAVEQISKAIESMSAVIRSARKMKQ